MAAPKGNQYAKGADSGRPKLIQSPEHLLQLFKDYQDFCKDNPILKEDYVGKDAMRVFRQLERPLTWVGFECYLSDMEIIQDLGDYERNKEGRYEEFTTIISRIKKYIESDQFSGAAVGIYQQNIIARKLGLSDNNNNVNKNTNENNSLWQGNLNPDQFDQLLNAVTNGNTPSGASEPMGDNNTQ